MRGVLGEGGEGKGGLYKLAGGGQGLDRDDNQNQSFRRCEERFRERSNVPRLSPVPVPDWSQSAMVELSVAK